ncbi:family 43 glycosylhydrolase [Paenibacillus guangzhouensis]|uniref:family 43 glycosylhydrolase n=1 Tax=Paenibacillus guangzhouensis TaxID=1473112 RepID=UPI0012672366|nr:family 43 glycosylhydrolase [Paenibacillus guangzhouensis]
MSIQTSDHLIPRNVGWTADNGNGTYTNPILWGDYPDNDVIRVGDTYYMSSTSMHLFPGCPIMRSQDLVNWEYASYAVERMEGDPYDLIGGDVYDEGPWATSLRYHQGKFYLMFNINHDAAYVSIADRAEGPWTLYKLEDELYDPGLFFDEDGKIYVVHGQGELYLSELAIVNEATGQLSIRSKREPGARRNGKKIYSYPCPGHRYHGYNEGAHVYKINGLYYILTTPIWKHGSKKEVAIRTKDLAHGPYEVEDIMTSFMNFWGNGIHQGGIVDVPQEDGTSEWWAIIFQDRSKLGRVPTLQPVEWKNGWPYMGQVDGEKAVVTHPKPNIPNVGYIAPKALPTSDDFRANTLGLQWQWNHNPDNSKWSLEERPGYMRLHTSSVTENLSYARNTLTQRVVGPDCVGTVKLDVSHMANGDVAGLCLMQKEFTYIGIKYDEGRQSIVINDNSIEHAAVTLPDSIQEVWFRAEMPRHEYRMEFFYSTDGITFTRLGGRYDMRYGTYVGMRFGIFNYATTKLGGYVDVDSFVLTTTENQGNLFGMNRQIDAGRYDDQKFVSDKELLINARTEWISEDANREYDLCISNLKDGDWLQYDQVDFGAGEASWFNARVASSLTGGSMEVRLGSIDGQIISTLSIPNTGDMDQYVQVKSDLTVELTGIHSIVLVFHGASQSMCKLNWFMFGSGVFPQIPPIPTNVTVVAENESMLNMKWDASPGALQYDLMLDDLVISNVTSDFSQTGLAPSSRHTVKVRAKNIAGYSAWSDGVQATTFN